MNAKQKLIEEISKKFRYFQKELIFKKVSKVISCENCNGTGFNTYSELTDYHKREYDNVTSVCVKCDGDGRLTDTQYKIFASNHELTETVPYSKNSIFEPIQKIETVRFKLEEI